MKDYVNENKHPNFYLYHLLRHISVCHHLIRIIFSELSKPSQLKGILDEFPWLENILFKVVPCIPGLMKPKPSGVKFPCTRTANFYFTHALKYCR